MKAKQQTVKVTIDEVIDPETNEPIVLTHQRFLFCEAWLQTFNVAGSAQSAYGHEDRRMCAVLGAKLMRKRPVQLYLKWRLSTVVMTTNEVLGRLAKVARFDPGDYMIFDEGTKKVGVDWNKLEKEGATICVRRVYNNAYGQQIEFHDPMEALKLLAKHLGLLGGRDGAHQLGPDVVLHLHDHRITQIREMKDEELDKYIENLAIATGRARSGVSSAARQLTEGDVGEPITDVVLYEPDRVDDDVQEIPQSGEALRLEESLVHGGPL